MELTFKELKMIYNDSSKLMQVEKKVDFGLIVRSKSESVMMLAKENYGELITFVAVLAKNYLSYCFPNQTGLAAQFSADLIETRPTWKAADFINLFKFFRQRQDLDGLKVFGNTITGQKLMEMVSVYEEHRAIELEKYMSEKRGEYQQPGERRFSDDSIKSQLGRMMEATSARQEEKRQKGQLHENKVAPDENYFKQV